MSSPSARILFLSAELAPLAQAGGLGDAVAGLAGALRARGHEVTCAIPAYRDLLRHPELPELDRHTRARPGGDLEGRWRSGRLASGVGLAVLDIPEHYDRPGLYEPGPGEAKRFIAFSRAAAALAVEIQPDVVVAHDWHAALAIGLLRRGSERAAAEGIATVQAVHNGAFIGRFPASEMDHTGLDADLFRPDGVEFFGDLCLLKAGLLFADRIVAVSPRYAIELTTPELGGGLDGLYRARSAALVGIANGLDVERFDPERDHALAAPYSAQRPEGRARCRAALLSELSLEAPPPGRLMAAVGRLSVQKGWDVLAGAADGLVRAGAALALVGEGDPAIGDALESAARRHPGRIRFVRGWKEPLARRVYAGSDLLLVPSRFEPCGLVQLLAQRYGSLPVAHRVGGLSDTIRDGKTGVLFEPLTPSALVAAAERAHGLLAGPEGRAVRSRLMDLDVSWAEPARAWEAALVHAVGVASGVGPGVGAPGS